MKTNLCIQLWVGALLFNVKAYAEDNIETPRVNTGVVIDSENQKPIIGATIQAVGTELSVVSDDSGTFRFEQSVAVGTILKIEASGYSSKDITFDTWPMSVALVPLSSASDKDPEENIGSTPKKDTVTVRGTIIDAENKKPMPDASIVLRQTNEVISVADDGSFELEVWPDDNVELVFAREGYETLSLSVSPDDTKPVIQMLPLSMETLVVVGRATQVERRKVATSIARVDNTTLNRVPAENISQALQGKVAGADIQANSGAPGGGIQIRLRGISTINGLSSPLYVVDGVFVSDVAIPSGLSRVSLSSRGDIATRQQDNAVNRIGDLNPYDFADVQILKGAAAAAIYGSKASNGVVVITTRRGMAEDPQFTFSQRVGFNELANTIGSRNFETVEEAVEVFGETVRDVYSTQTFDHERELASRKGLLLETALSLSGGSESGTDYFLSFLNRSDEGIIPGTEYQKTSLRLTLGHNFFDRLDMMASANIIRTFSDRGISNNDNSSTSHYMVLPSTPNFFPLRQNGELVANPFAGGTNPLQTAELFSNDEEVTRIITGARGDLLLWDSEHQKIRILAVGGIDRFVQTNRIDSPPDLFFEPADEQPGTAVNGDSSATSLNFSANIVHEYVSDSNNLQLTTSGGFQFESRNVSSTYIVSRAQTAGRTDVDSGTQIEVDEFNRDTNDFGVYLQEDIGLWDSLFIAGSIRMEKSSSNANADTYYAYPKASAAFAVPWSSNLINLLKLRLAYGETGNQARYGQRFTPLNASNTIDGLPTLIGSGGTGSGNLKPERQREIEGGIDLSMFRGRLDVELSVYNREISDLILARTPAPSSGFADEIINAGKLRNTGIELTVNATPVRIQHFRMNLTITFAHNQSEVLDLGGVPGFSAGGFGTGLGEFFIEEGKSATQIRGFLPDGSIGQIGDSSPDFRMGFLHSLDWRLGEFGGLSFSYLLDWQQGGDVINLTEFLYDANANSPDYEDAGRLRQERFRTTTQPYVQDASYLRLRELSLFYDIPDAFVYLIPNAKSLRLGFTARNLFTITDYRGLDPEVSNFGNQAIGRNIDVAPYPPSRTYWWSLQATF